ncbi:MAG: efflux RND transporter periplasmic adaptor subunit [Pirellulales bacterium]
MRTLVFLPAACAVLLGFAGCDHKEHEVHIEAHKIVATSPVVRDMWTTQPYVAQIHSCRHIQVRALMSGYLEPIPVNEGQQVNQSDILFNIFPVLYQARLDTDIAERKQVEIELRNTRTLFDKKIVSQQEVALAEAKLAKAEAKVKLASAELNFTRVSAPFAGIIDRLHEQQGSLVEEGDILTTLSDNSLMWVYFNVPEARYLEYMTTLKQRADELKIELKLANGSVFDQVGKIGAIEADFNNETGNISFRADFPNPDRLLRHGQTGTVMISRVQRALVIPQRAKFEILAKQYVFVIDKDNKVRQREITIDKELDDIYLVKDGISVDDKIVLEGVRQVRDGEEVEFEFQAPEEVLSHLKYRAE